MVRLGILIAAAAFVAGPVSGTEAERLRVAAATAPAKSFTAAEPYEANPGGATSVAAPDPRRAFLHPPANLPLAGQADFLAGQGVFDKIWVAAPATTRASDGLGPLYNARSCLACHRNNGRGHAPANSGAAPVSFVLHLGVEGDGGAVLPEPVYGRQLQSFATVGLRREGALGVTWHPLEVILGDGERMTLRRPEITVTDLAAGPFAPGTMASARIAPPMIGLGLLAAIPTADILARQDPDDADGDGISGRANFVEGLGRFGWKAGVATLHAQTAIAFATDLGLSTPLLPAPWGDCTEAQQACRHAPHGDGDARGAEVSAAAFDLVSRYAGNIAVPRRRDVASPEVLAGKRLFYGLGCTGCHVPKFVTAREGVAPEHRFQLIWPYTDLLLHDMGPGLADGFREGRATGREWRTPPLWGIGLTAAVSGETTYLHDGRARSLLEAVLWHGGEARPARDAVAALPADDRAALIRFLESL